MDKLAFSSDQSALLGLEEGEAVRVLATGSKTIVLERVHQDVSEALPWDRDLVLNASVRSFSLADVLHLLHASSKSGFLLFENGDHTKSVYLHRGEVVFAASNQKFDRLGECLLRSGAITPEQFKEAEEAYSPTGPFGKVLVEREFLTPRELWSGVKLQIEEIVRSLFSYGAGSVLFWEGEIRPDNVVRLSLPTRRLIAEGLKRRDELLRFVTLLETPRVRIQAVDDGGKNLTGIEREMFEAVAAGGSFKELCHRAGVEPLCGARTIQHLCLVDAATVAREAAPSPAEERDVSLADDEAVRECVLAHVKLLAEFAAPIVAVEGDSGIRERLERIIDDAASRYPDLLSELSVGAGGVLDPEALIQRALAYPGEREREVRLALGELVSYLEFELTNHPKIPCPEDYLEDLQDLRARL